MKSSILLAVMVMVVLAGGVLGAAYSGGNGEPNNPYKIANVADFQTLSATPTDWYKSFVLTANIDLTSLTFVQAPVAPDANSTDEYNEFQGTQFTGIFDGNGYTISNLTITAPAKDYIGLFGYVGSGGKIKNLGIDNVNITGRLYVCGLVGWNDSGSLTSCHAAGSVSGGSYVGGLVGYGNGGSLTSCYAAGSIIGTGEYSYVGGLIGLNYDKLTACYATGTVNGSNYVGGLVGGNYGPITSCYATGMVNGSNYVGGLVGENTDSLTYCYATGAVSGGSYVGGLMGVNSGVPTACFWDITTSGQANGVGDSTPTGVTGKTTAEMKTPSTFTSAGWDFAGESANGLNDYWQMAVNDYPRFTVHIWTLAGNGTSANPYIVANAADLGKVWSRPSACYRLGGNLDLTGILWSSAVIRAIEGDFDGQGFVISHLTINQPDSHLIGLFGSVDSGGQVRNLGVENITITGRYYVGGLAGRNLGTLTACRTAGSVSGGFYVGGLAGRNVGMLTACWTTGSVSGTGDYVGGLVGENYSALTACYATCSVSGSYYAGGLAGQNTGTLTACYAAGSVNGTGEYSYVGGLVGLNYDKLTACYATGTVNGSNYVGGFVGLNYGTLTACYATGPVSGRYVGGFVGENYGTPTACFWDIQTSGKTVGVGSGTSAGVTGKMTADMKKLLTFTSSPANWDFTNEITNGINDFWRMCVDGIYYPKLSWQSTSGDLTCPDGVNSTDFAVLAQNWLAEGCGGCGHADLTGDKKVDFDDLQVMAANWLQGV